MSYLPEEEYKKMFNLMPVCCVDLVLVHTVLAHNDSFLLVKRTMEPMKGKWWFPSGRVYKGEKLTGAVKRIAKDELGLSVKIEKKIGVYEGFFDNGPFGLKNVHNIIICFLVSSVEPHLEIKLDETSSAYRWYADIAHPYLKKVLEDI